MLYAGDSGIVSMSAKDIAKMMAIIVNVFESAGLTMSEKKTKTMLLRAPDQALRTCRSSSKQQARDIDRQRSSFIWAVLSTQSPTFSQILNGGSDLPGDAANGAVRYRGCSVHDEGAHAKGRGDGDSTVWVCNVDPRQGARRRATNGAP